MTKTYTKRELYAALINTISGMEDFEVAVNDDTVLYPADVAIFLQKEIDMIDKKNAKARERAEIKRSEADSLLAAVESALADDYQVISDIIDQIEGDDVTASKVVRRLSVLVKDGRAEKADVKVERDGKVATLKGYRKVSL